MAVAAPSAQAQAPTWPCDAFGYLFQTQGGGAPTSDIVQVDLATGVQTTIGSTPQPVNANGYNILDGYYYGSTIDLATGLWTTARIHPDGSIDDLGVASGPGGTMDPTVTTAIADVDPNGHYWVIQGNGGAGSVWYEVDLTTPTPTVLRSGPVTVPAGLNVIGADWSWVDGALYSVGADTALNEFLLRFDPATGTFTNLGPVGIPPGTGNIGATFVDASGYLYASQNATNSIYRIDITTRQTILASDAEGTSPGNDGGRCAAAVVPTITVTKTVNGRVRAADQFTVGLRRPDGSLADSATTSGAGTTASTVNFPASQGTTYTITDAMATGSPTPLGEYVKSIACVDADGNAVATGGSGPTWTLAVASATFYTCNVTNAAVADVVLEKTAAPTPIVPGEDVTFSLKVTNNGPSTAVNQTVTDQLPAEVTFSSASAGCGEATGTVTCAVGDLAPGASQTVTITGRVASSLDECLENTATTAGSTFDPNTSNNSSTICTPINGRSNLSISKDPSAPTVAAGGQVMYTLVVRNNGPTDDPGTEVIDAMPAGLTLVSANPSQGSCTTTNNVVSCDMGLLKDGGSAQVLVTANAPATGGCITNTARVRGAHEDPDPANNQDSAQICTVPPPPATFDLEVEKRTSVSRPLVGQRVTYRIVVTNNGPAAAPDVAMTDTLNAPVRVVRVRTTAGSCTRRIPMRCELGTIAAGESVTIRITVKHREATGCSPRQRQAASATGNGTDANPANNMDTVDVCVRKVRLVLSKLANRSTVRAGETFGYRIRVRNPTKGEARKVKVCDRLPSGLRYVSSKPTAKRSGVQRCWTVKRLKAGKSRTFRVTVRAARGANGRVNNRATAGSRDARATVRAQHRIRVLGVATPVTG